MLQVPAILRHGLLDGVPSMVEGLRFMVVDDRVGARGEMLVFVEPYVNVPPKGCALLIRAMDRIETSSQPCIAQQLVLPHVVAFSSSSSDLWIIVLVVLLLLGLSSDQILLMCDHFALCHESDRG